MSPISHSPRIRSFSPRPLAEARGAIGQGQQPAPTTWPCSNIHAAAGHDRTSFPAASTGGSTSVLPVSSRESLVQRFEALLAAQGSTAKSPRPDSGAPHGTRPLVDVVTETVRAVTGIAPELLHGRHFGRTLHRGCSAKSWTEQVDATVHKVNERVRANDLARFGPISVSLERLLVGGAPQRRSAAGRQAWGQAHDHRRARPRNAARLAALRRVALRA